MSRISGKCMKFSMCIIHLPSISSTLFPVKRVPEPRLNIYLKKKSTLKIDNGKPFIKDAIPPPSLPPPYIIAHMGRPIPSQNKNDRNTDRYPPVFAGFWGLLDPGGLAKWSPILPKQFSRLGLP